MTFLLFSMQSFTPRTIGCIVGLEVGTEKTNNTTGFVHIKKSQIQGLSRTFKTMYQQIQALNTEKKALEISTMSRWIVQNATLMNFKQLCQIRTCKINSTKCPFLNVKQVQKISHKLKQEEFMNFQVFLYKFQDIQGLEFLSSNSRTFKAFKFSTNPGQLWPCRHPGM